MPAEGARGWSVPSATASSRPAARASCSTSPACRDRQGLRARCRRRTSRRASCIDLKSRPTARRSSRRSPAQIAPAPGAAAAGTRAAARRLDELPVVVHRSRPWRHRFGRRRARRRDQEKAIVLGFRQAPEGEARGDRALRRVVMTRDDDSFISLPSRVDVARANNAALFVSIHADTLPRSVGVRGRDRLHPVRQGLGRRGGAARREGEPRRPDRRASTSRTSPTTSPTSCST